MATQKVKDQGQVNTTAGTIYTVPAANVFTVQKLSLFNTDTSAAVTVTVEILDVVADTSSAARTFDVRVVGAKTNEQVNISGHGVPPGGSIRLSATPTANVVNWHLTGTLQTQASAATGSAAGF